MSPLEMLEIKSFSIRIKKILLILEREDISQSLLVFCVHQMFILMEIGGDSGVLDDFALGNKHWGVIQSNRYIPR